MTDLSGENNVGGDLRIRDIVSASRPPAAT
jgi:hypothetical protein